MQFPFTDKFLWDLYNFLEKISDLYDIFAPRPWREVWCPELHQFKRKYQKKKARKEFSRLIYYLKKKGLIKIKNLEQKQAILITKKGAEKILKIKLKMTKRKKRPDGKWQMIIFDIPESKRHLRHILREHLRLLGYKMLQQSVWVCPYDVLKETEAVLRKYGLDGYVKLFLIEEMEI